MIKQNLAIFCHLNYADAGNSKQDHVQENNVMLLRTTKKYGPMSPDPFPCRGWGLISNSWTSDNFWGILSKCVTIAMYIWEDIISKHILQLHSLAVSYHKGGSNCVVVKLHHSYYLLNHCPL